MAETREALQGDQQGILMETREWGANGLYLRGHRAIRLVLAEHAGSREDWCASTSLIPRAEFCLFIPRLISIDDQHTTVTFPPLHGSPFFRRSCMRLNGHYIMTLHSSSALLLKLAWD